MNDWISRNLTRNSLVMELFRIPEVYGIYNGEKKIVILMRDNMWTSDSKRRIERAFAVCYPPLGFDMEALARWRKLVYG